MFDLGNSGWMFYVDRGLRSVRAVRATHVPASNYVVVPTEAGMKEPIGMALATADNRVILLVTDPGAGCIWTVNVTSIVSPKRGGGEKPASSNSEEESEGGKAAAASATVPQAAPKKMTLVSALLIPVVFRTTPRGMKFW
jgi:hypothetical protein